MKLLIKNKIEIIQNTRFLFFFFKHCFFGFSTTAIDWLLFVSVFFFGSRFCWIKHVPFAKTTKQCSCTFTLSAYELVMALPVNTFKLVKRLEFSTTEKPVNNLECWWWSSIIFSWNVVTALLILSGFSEWEIGGRIYSRNLASPFWFLTILCLVPSTLFCASQSTAFFFFESTQWQHILGWMRASFCLTQKDEFFHTCFVFWLTRLIAACLNLWWLSITTIVRRWWSCSCEAFHMESQKSHHCDFQQILTTSYHEVGCTPCHILWPIIFGWHLT